MKTRMIESGWTDLVIPMKLHRRQEKKKSIKKINAKITRDFLLSSACYSVFVKKKSPQS